MAKPVWFHHDATCAASHLKCSIFSCYLPEVTSLPCCVASAIFIYLPYRSTIAECYC